MDGGDRGPVRECFFAAVFFLPIYLQLGAGVAASHSGPLLLPLTLGMVTGSTTTGRIVARTSRPTPMPRIGLTLSACMLLLLGVLTPTAWTVGLCGFICGMGFGTVMPTAQVTIQTLAGRQRLGAAAAIVSLSRSLGAVLGTAVFGALVFGLLHGVDIAESARNGHAAVVVHPLQIGFMETAGVALLGAACAFRLPRITCRHTPKSTESLFENGRIFDSSSPGPAASLALNDPNGHALCVTPGSIGKSWSEPMKSMTCRELGGPCDQELTAETWDAMVKTMTQHVLEKHPETAKAMEKTHNEDPKRWGRETKPKWDAKPDR